MLTCIIPTLKGQSLWTSAEFKARIIKRVNVFAEGEYRTTDKLASTDRWAGTAGIDYRPWRFLKMTAGYTYIHQHEETEVTKKGNIIPAYWQPKNRSFFALTGSYDWKRFTLSLRERYQYTHRKEQYVPKFDDDGITQKNDELVVGKHKHLLRSRLELEYNIRKSGFSPYISCELYNSLSDGFVLDKTRWMAGTSYKVNRHNSISLYYCYINKSDDDEASGNVIGIGYRFRL